MRAKSAWIPGRPLVRTLLGATMAVALGAGCGGDDDSGDRGRPGAGDGGGGSYISFDAATQAALAALDPADLADDTIVYGAQTVLPGGSTLGTATPQAPRTLPADSYLFWADHDPAAEYGHDTTVVVVDAETAAVMTAPSVTWPVVNDEPWLADPDERAPTDSSQVVHPSASELDAKFSSIPPEVPEDPAADPDDYAGLEPPTGKLLAASHAGFLLCPGGRPSFRRAALVECTGERAKGYDIRRLQGALQRQGWEVETLDLSGEMGSGTATEGGGASVAEGALSRWLLRATAGMDCCDELLVYLTGHAIGDTLLVGAYGAEKAGFVRYEIFVRQLALIGTCHKTLVVDAAGSEMLIQEVASTTAALTPGQRIETFASAGLDRPALYSNRPYAPAQIRFLAGSVLTWHLAHAIHLQFTARRPLVDQDGDGEVSIREAFDHAVTISPKLRCGSSPPGERFSTLRDGQCAAAGAFTVAGTCGCAVPDPGALPGALVTLVALPPVIPADGSSRALLRVSVVDTATGARLPDAVVTVAATLGTLDPGADADPGLPGVQILTDAQGEATIQLTSSVSPTTAVSDVTATLANGSTAAAQVTFLVLGVPVLAGVTALPDTIPADGASDSLVTARVIDSLTGLPLAGEVVSFTTTAGTLDPAADVDPVQPGVQVPTDPLGLASVALTSEILTVTATADVTAALASGASGGVTVTFLAGPAFYNAAIRPQAAPADDVTELVATADLVESGGVPLIQVCVDVIVSGPATLASPDDCPQDPTPQSLSAPPGGTVQARLVSSVPGTGTVRFLDVFSGAYVDLPYEFRCIPGAGAGIANLQVLPPVVPADGQSSALIWGALLDGGGCPVVGATVDLAASAGTPASASRTTGPDGAFGFLLTSVASPTDVLSVVQLTSPVGAATVHVLFQGTVSPGCALARTWQCAFQVASDACNLDPSVGLRTAQLDLAQVVGFITVDSVDPGVVPALGLTPDCLFLPLATGQGTVAGVAGVSVEYRNLALDLVTGTLFGEYAIGVGGELPGGCPLIYTFTGVP